LDKPVIEAEEALDDKEKGPGLVAIAEAETEVKRDSNMASKSSQGAPKTFKKSQTFLSSQEIQYFWKKCCKNNCFLT